MSGIPPTFPGLPSSKTATKAILQSILDVRITEPSAIPRFTSSIFDQNSNFVENIARLVMERRTTGSSADAFTKAKPNTQPPGEARDVTINQQTVRKLYGGTGNDRLTVNASGVDQVSAGAGNDTVIITATMRGTYPAGAARPATNDAMNKMYAMPPTMELVSGGAGIDTLIMPGAYPAGAARPATNDAMNKMYAMPPTMELVSGGASNDTLIMPGAYPAGAARPATNDAMNKMYAMPPTMVLVSAGASLQAVPGIRPPGIAGLDDGSVTRVSGGAGDDRIRITADQLVHSVSGGDGNDEIQVSGNFVSTVTGGAGVDVISIAGHSVDGIDGNSGDDVISIMSVIDKSLDGDNDLLAFSSGSGNVTHVTGGSGKDKITIRAERDVYDVDAGTSNDVIDIEAGNRLMGISGGSGNDTMTLKGDEVAGIMGGTGNDGIDIRARKVDQVYGGTGNDTISISAVTDVGRIEGGTGSDKIEISGRMIHGVDGGEGDDEIYIRSPERTETAASGNVPAYLSSVYGVEGGSGKDKITVNVEGIASGIDGGDSDDTISVTASAISVTGGKGNDTINLTKLSANDSRKPFDSEKAVSIYFAEGDGNDTLTTNSDLVIKRYSEDGLKDLGLAGAALTSTGTGEYKLTFAGSTDSITIRRNNPAEVPGSMVPVINGNRIEFHASAA